MSNVENLQIEANASDTNTSAACEDVSVTKDVSFHLAKHTEMKNWSDNSVFEEVREKKCISSGCVCTLKETGDWCIA